MSTVITLDTAINVLNREFLASEERSRALQAALEALRYFKDRNKAHAHHVIKGSATDRAITILLQDGPMTVMELHQKLNLLGVPITLSSVQTMLSYEKNLFTREGKKTWKFLL